MRRFIPILTAALLLLLPSCAPSDGFSAGRPVSKDELASISAELFTQGEEPVSGTGDEPTYTDREPNTYYWTESGSVYHKYRDCRHLKDYINKQLPFLAYIFPETGKGETLLLAAFLLP